MKNQNLTRRDFLRDLGIISGGAVLLGSPWLSVFADTQATLKEKCRLAVIGPGSRGRFLMGFLVQNPRVEIVALHDIYQPSIDEALKLAPKAKVYSDYRKLLGHEAIEQERTLVFPDEYKIDYLNHRSTPNTQAV